MSCSAPGVRPATYVGEFGTELDSGEYRMAVANLVLTLVKEGNMHAVPPPQN